VRNLKENLKLLALLLVFMLVFALFAGCAPKGDSSLTEKKDTQSETVNKDTQVEVSKQEPITMDFWYVQTKIEDIVNGSISRFEADNSNVKINVTSVDPDAYKNKIVVAMGSGTTPDVYISWSGGRMNEYADAGQAMDITEYMKEDNYVDKFLDGAIEQGSYNGKIYGVPVENLSVAGVFYNKDIYNKYGLSVPETLSELENNCDILLDNSIIPFALANAPAWTGSFYFMYLATRFGGVDPFKDAVSGKGSFDSEPFIFAGQKIQEWVEKGYFNEGFNGLDEGSGQSRQLIYSEKCAMIVMGSWLVKNVTSENSDFIEKLGFFAFPVIEGSDANPDIVVGSLGDNFYHVSPKAEDTKMAFKAITYLLDDEAIEQRKEMNKIVPFKSFTSDNPILKIVLDAVAKAPAVQLWYDQYLPATVTDAHLSTSQSLFGLGTTPEKAAKDLQNAMAEHINSNK
jgi:raffinose/stachyose/melibiose transport system substrate-binding protein